MNTRIFVYPHKIQELSTVLCFGGLLAVTLLLNYNIPLEGKETKKAGSYVR